MGIERIACRPRLHRRKAGEPKVHLARGSRFGAGDRPGPASPAGGENSLLSEVGGTVSLENIANATFRERLGKGDFDIAVGNWSPDFSDPYMFMNYWFDSTKQGMSGNRSFYSNPKVDELVRKAAAESGQAERTKLYQEAQKIVIGDAAYVYLFQRNSEVAMRSDVKGFVYNPMLEQIYNLGEMSKAK